MGHAASRLLTHNAVVAGCRVGVVVVLHAQLRLAVFVDVLSPFFFFLYDAVYLYNRPMYPLYLLLLL